MTEMVEPDRTIMIVSIIGLVVIWGSFFYHRYLQDGNAQQEFPPPDPGGEGISGSADASADSPQEKSQDGAGRRRKGRAKTPQDKNRRQ
jgi:hypothetical protein